MKLYRHTTVEPGFDALVELAWVTRITQVDRGQTVAEIWAVWLPSWGVEYHLPSDSYRFGRRGFWLNLRTGERGWMHCPSDSSNADP